jgi:hypothetical protein
MIVQRASENTNRRQKDLGTILVAVLVQIFLRVCFCPGEKASQILGGQGYGPNFRSGGRFSG